MLCPGSGPRVVVLFILLLLAVVDTWFEGLGSSVVLGGVHLAVVKLGYDSGVCCW